MGLQALLPQPPDGAHEVAFEGADSLALGLALMQAARDVVLGRGPTAQLGQGNTVEDGVEPPVAPAVETVADAARRGRFERGDARVGGELRLAREALTRSQEAGERARGKQIDALELRQGGKARLGAGRDLPLQVGRLLRGQAQTLGQAAYARGPRLLQ